MRRREFISLFGSSAAAWPLSAYAQQAGGMRRVGFLNSLAESDPEARKVETAFRQMLQQLGWTEGQNFQIEYRWGAGDGDRIRKNAAEMAALA
jgi:putative ABC transport system substrate-binding protein